MTHETDGDRRARLAEIRACTNPSDERAIWQERQFLLAELERVEQERDAAHAREAKLREALEAYVDSCRHTGEDWHIEPDKCALCVPARAALAGEKP